MLINSMLLVPSFGISSDNRLISTFPTGLYSLKEACRPLEWEVDVLNLTGDIENERFPSLEKLGERILATFDLKKYGIIGFSTMGGTFPLSILLAERVRQKNPNMTIILGGPHASFLPGEILTQFGFIDAVVIGEGESALAHMLTHFKQSAYSWKGIPGVMTRHSPFISRELLKNLDLLPILKYGSVRRSYFKGDGTDQNEIEGVRGCFAKCKFCSTTRFWQNRVRRKSAERLIDEMRQIAGATGLKTFHIVGDNFTTPIRGFRKFCRVMILKGKDLRWKCSCRIGDLEPDDLRLMKDAGCTDIFVGIESASQLTLSRLNKEIALDATLRMTEAAIDTGITITASQIVGFPWETKRDVWDTLRQHTRLLELGVKKSIVNPLFPLAGAEGFPGVPIRTDQSLIDGSLPDIFRDEYSKTLIRNHPTLFSQFGYYETEHLDRQFVMTAVETARQITAMKADS